MEDKKYYIGLLILVIVLKIDSVFSEVEPSKEDRLNITDNPTEFIGGMHITDTSSTSVVSFRVFPPFS